MKYCRPSGYVRTYRDYVPGEDLSDVVVPNKLIPRRGDKIVDNTLITALEFACNFEEMVL